MYSTQKRLAGARVELAIPLPSWGTLGATPGGTDATGLRVCALNIVQLALGLTVAIIHDKRQIASHDDNL